MLPGLVRNQQMFLLETQQPSGNVQLPEGCWVSSSSKNPVVPTRRDSLRLGFILPRRIVFIAVKDAGPECSDASSGIAS